MDEILTQIYSKFQMIKDYLHANKPTSRCQSAYRIVSSEVGWDRNIFFNIAIPIFTGDIKL